MHPIAPTLAQTLARLRLDFDQSFTRAPATDHVAAEMLLAIRVADDAYALRLNEIAGLAIDRHLVPIPTTINGLLGVAGFRGQVVPVYDLAVLLGYAARPAPRWLVLVRREETVALAFDKLEAQLRVWPEQWITTEQGTEQRPDHIAGAVRADTLRPIVHLPAILATITQAAKMTRLAEQTTVFSPFGKER